MSWRARAPKTRRERRALKRRCGARAFLDPDRLMFPVMAKHGRCVIDCEGARAALSRARQFQHPRFAAKAARAVAACRRG